MSTSGRSWLAGWLLLLALPGLVAAQDPDTAEVQRYTLTQAALTKYAQATRNLIALEGACEDEDTEPRSLDEMVAELEDTPGAKDALQSAGMTMRDYVVFSLSLLQTGFAAFAASQPGAVLPPGVSKANVDFINAHRTEIERLGEIGSQACDGAAEEEEEIEE